MDRTAVHHRDDLQLRDVLVLGRHKNQNSDGYVFNLLYNDGRLYLGCPNDTIANYNLVCDQNSTSCPQQPVCVANNEGYPGVCISPATCSCIVMNQDTWYCVSSNGESDNQAAGISKAPR